MGAIASASTFKLALVSSSAFAFVSLSVEQADSACRFHSEVCFYAWNWMPSSAG